MESTVLPSWAPRSDRLRPAVERLVAAAQPKQIILFGSPARGDADDHSDIDLLVVEPVVEDRFGEMIRLNRALKAGQKGDAALYSPPPKRAASPFSLPEITHCRTGTGGIT